MDDSPAVSAAAVPFWRKPLASLTTAEWERLCDGCGRCCLVKLEDEDTGSIHFTDVSCALLDAGSCRCSDYANRQAHVPDCVKLTPELVDSIPWLPPTCAYRLVAEGRDLMWWHPLVSGRADTVHEAGISIRRKPTISETEVAVEDLPARIVSWPAKWPKKARKTQQERQPARVEDALPSCPGLSPPRASD